MPFNFIVLATPPFTAFGFIHDKNNEYYQFCGGKKSMTEGPQKQYKDTDDEEPTGAKPILSPWMKTVILWSVILLLIAGGAAATYFGAREVLRAKASMDWPTAQGKIIESSVERETRRRKPGESGPLNRKIYRAKILYE